ncbi:YceI family protein [Rhodothermus profundi]|uniref:Polyisoprenoid-binding protein YceI n=1 Tax=Rhodothermus profundi TaxID=633813 RepID=A0A1M6RSP4_9BACT|nr:YceI family protein [Rhodothermus profundi]SHK35521.1 Polyisoprenoid-binding protein YceI [Rhodothermus profundi]
MAENRGGSNRGRLRMVVGLLMIGAGVAQAQPVTLALQSEGSSFEVRGTSTLHDWTCTVTDWQGTVSLETFGDSVWVQAAVVVVPVTALACGNGAMDRKLRRALKADVYPEIRFVLTQVDSVERIPEGYRLYVQGQLTVAGAERAVRLQVLARAEKAGWRFQGMLPLSMRAFGIKPPTAMLGVLRTGDQVVVRFEVGARPVSGTPKAPGRG